MNRLQRVIKSVVNIDLIGSIVFSILILGAVGFSILQPHRVPSDPFISPTTQQLNSGEFRDI